jgi:hypothetical protein
MPRARQLLAAAVLTAALAFCRPAAAATLGIGGDLLTDPTRGAFQVTVAADKALMARLSVGGRIGLTAIAGAPRLGVPADLWLRLHGRRLYLEALVGPWLFLDRAYPIRVHGAVGFGVVSSGRTTVGLEVGVLDRAPMVGLRVGIPL